MTAAYHHTGFFFNKESYDRIRSLLVFSSEFLHFRRTEFSTVPSCQNKQEFLLQLASALRLEMLVFVQDRTLMGYLSLSVSLVVL